MNSFICVYRALQNSLVYRLQFVIALFVSYTYVYYVFVYFLHE